MLSPLNHIDSLIEDLSLYLNVHKDTVRRFIGYSQRAMEEGSISVPKLWRWMYGHRPGTEDEHKLFYALNPLYIFDLANFAGEFNINCAGAGKYAKGYCLDFGCGIGTVALELSEIPEVRHVDCTDIAIISTDFLRFRLLRRANDPMLSHVWVLDPTLRSTPESPQAFRTERSTHLSLPHHDPNDMNDPHPGYDFIYARDVFEHIINRVPVLDKVLEHLKPGGVLCEASPIEGYDAETGFENVAIRPEGDIWDLLKARGFEKISSDYTGGMSLGMTNCWRKP